MKNNDINFECIEELVDYIVDCIDDVEDCFISVIGKFDKIKDMICALMKYDRATFSGLKIYAPDYNGYEDEYVLVVWDECGEINLGCKPAMKDGKYLNIQGTYAYIFDDSNSRILKSCIFDKIYFVTIGDEDFDCAKCYCDECHSCDKYKNEQHLKKIVDIDDNLHGFTASKTSDNGYYSYSYYTSDALNKDEILDMLKEFGF